MYERIRKLCEDKNMSLAQLEREVGLSAGAISKWKLCVPRADVLLAIAEKLETTVEYLIKGEETAEPQEEVS